MKLQPNGTSAVLAAGAIVCGGTPFATAASAVVAPWKNCTQVNQEVSARALQRRTGFAQRCAGSEPVGPRPQIHG